MSSRSGRGLRASRGVAAAAAATFFATVSHSAVTGHLPSAWSVVVLLAMAAPVCVLLSGRGLSWARSAAAVGVSQALFHALLSVDFGGSSAGAQAAVEAHVHGTAVAAALTTAAEAPVHDGGSPWMWAAHLVAALLTVLALGHGERAIRALWRLVRDPFRALIAFRRLPVLALPRLAGAPPPRRGRLAVLSVMRLRGPPVSA